jgi:hypothetical protein
MTLKLISTLDAPASARKPRRRLRAPTVRPTERHEPWSISGVVTADLAHAADEAGVAVAVAVAVVVERRLLLDLLPTPNQDAQWLDRQAARARPHRELTDSSAAYLRALANGSQPRAGATPAASGLGHVTMPARLSDRLLGAWPPKPDLRADELYPALSWERAAVLSGLTLTEWGLTEVLRR